MPKELKEERSGNVAIVDFFRDGDRLKPTVRFETVNDTEKAYGERAYLLHDESQFEKLRHIKEELKKTVPQISIDGAWDIWTVVRVENMRLPEQRVDEIYKKLHVMLADAGFSIIGFDSDSYEDGVDEEVIINHGLIVDTKKYQEYKDRYQEKK